MSTQGIVSFHDESGHMLARMYHPIDGYPQELARKLYEFLSGFQIVNGMRGDLTGKIANGMGCLAAQWVAHCAGKPGSIYLIGETAWVHHYEYRVYYTEYDNQLWIKFIGKDEVCWGSPQDMLNALNPCPPSPTTPAS